MAKSKLTHEANTRQLARMLMADTSLTEGEKVELARTLAGHPSQRKRQTQETPDWLASHFAAHDAAQATQVAKLRRRRHRALLATALTGLLVTVVVMWMAAQWGVL